MIQRIQLLRCRGCRKPEGAVVVARHGRCESGMWAATEVLQTNEEENNGLETA